MCGLAAPPAAASAKRSLPPRQIPDARPARLPPGVPGARSPSLKANQDYPGPKNLCMHQWLLTLIASPPARLSWHSRTSGVQKFVSLNFPPLQFMYYKCVHYPGHKTRACKALIAAAN